MSIRTLAVVSILGLASASASAALVSNFEAPTFTAGASVSGIDNWNVAASYGYITPGAPINRGYQIPTPAYGDVVLQGSQSLQAEGNAAWITKRITSDPDLGDGATLSYLTQIWGDSGTADVSLTHNVGGSTPVGVSAAAGGNFSTFGGSTTPDVSVPVINGKTYLVEMVTDFTAGNIQAYVTNVTDSGPRQHIGFATFATPFTTAQVFASGGLFLASNVEGPNNRPNAQPGDYSGVVYYDSFNIAPAVPEPASLSMLTLGALTMFRRIRRA